jgi:nitrogen fixation protein FixH
MRVRIWPLIVVVILALTVGANIWVAVIASADPSFAIEENYYARAVQFDLQRAQEARSDRLRWGVELIAGPASAEGTMLTATLRDSTGVPVRDATVRVRVRRVARSQQAAPADLAPAGDAYSAVVPMDAAGLWDVEVEARRGPARFVTQQRLDLTVAPRS